jgi:hypothetical protein
MSTVVSDALHRGLRERFPKELAREIARLERGR